MKQSSVWADRRDLKRLEKRTDVDTYYCLFVCVWKDRPESPLAEDVYITWQVLACRETLEEIHIGNFITNKGVISVKMYLKSGRACRRKIIWTQTNEWEEQCWRIIQKMKKEIDNNDIYVSAYRNRHVSELEEWVRFIEYRLLESCWETVETSVLFKSNRYTETARI